MIFRTSSFVEGNREAEMERVEAKSLTLIKLYLKIPFMGLIRRWNFLHNVSGKTELRLEMAGTCFADLPADSISAIGYLPSADFLIIDGRYWKSDRRKEALAALWWKNRGNQ